MLPSGEENLDMTECEMAEDHALQFFIPVVTQY